MDHLMETYKRLPVAFARGEGSWLVDTEGRRYLDALTGIAVCGLGHAHPRVTRAIAEQAGTLLHTSNLYRIPLQEQLADRLCALSGMERVFFGNSGAEANEAAIKIARLYGNQRNVGKPSIIVMDTSFHGRTMATLTATGSRKVQAGFEPLLTGFLRAPFNDVDAVANIARNSQDVVAILVEPVQGEGGIYVPDADYLARLRRICDDHGWFLMLDEVQTGNGRTGRYFAYQHTDILPDVVTTAKGLGNGIPIGACLARGTAATVFGPGNHGSTFGGNPLVCAAALGVLDALEQDGLIARAEMLGSRILSGLRHHLAGNNRVRDIRGLGLMIGIELADPCGELVTQGLADGILINVTRDNVVRLLPPLTLTDAEADAIVERVAALVNGDRG
ncbi:MAG TPA: aspartate aminotransferase family protein [Gammaproteobacteria bacterium]|jgi:acetylornithine aminotransferase|nr:aspartate aminotransferase family protein [Gammaproteobacteria bacterium]